MSETFKRMALVPEALLTSMKQYQQQQITPQTKNLVRLDNEMETILQNSSLPEDQKARLYSQTLQRYLTMYDKTKLPLPSTSINTTGNTPSPGTATSDVDSNNTNTDNTIENEVLQSVPKTMKGRAESLLKKLKLNPSQLSWNDRGELVSEGRVISGTNVIDLINDVLRPRNNFSPRGYDTFVQGLAKINAPEDLIRNDARRKLLLEYRNNPSQSTITRREDETPTPRPIFPTPPSSGRIPVRRRLPMITSRKQTQVTPERTSQWLDY